MSPDEAMGLHVAIARLQESHDAMSRTLGRMESKIDTLPCAAHSERMAVMETMSKTEGARAGGIFGGIISGVVIGLSYLVKLLLGK